MFQNYRVSMNHKYNPDCDCPKCEGYRDALNEHSREFNEDYPPEF